MSTATCPKCSAKFRSADEHAGKRFRCPKCANEFQVGSPQGQAVPVKPPVAPVVVKPTIVQPTVVNAPAATGTQAPRPSTPMASNAAPPAVGSPGPSSMSYPASFGAPQGNAKRKKSKPANSSAGLLIVVGVGVLAFGLCIGLAILVTSGGNSVEASNESGERLLDARRGMVTTLTERTADNEAPEIPPQGVFELVKYDSELGPMSAYVTPDAGDGKRRPAIVWLTGGFGNGIGSTAWTPGHPSNDQSASAYRNTGMVMMFPALRGGCDNPGSFECLWGEVDDVLAAAAYLAKQPHVDPDRIYVGGHSTGGTLALLCAASSDQFAGCVSLGPVDNVAGYGQGVLPFSAFDQDEVRFRSPIFWQHGIQCPTWIIEGSQGNADSARALQRNAEAINKDNIKVFIVSGKDHFNVVAYANIQMAFFLSGKIDESSLDFSGRAINKSSFE